jgi:hypothetical protein
MQVPVVEGPRTQLYFVKDLVVNMKRMVGRLGNNCYLAKGLDIKHSMPCPTFEISLCGDPTAENHHMKWSGLFSRKCTHFRVIIIKIDIPNSSLYCSLAELETNDPVIQEHRVSN